MQSKNLARLFSSVIFAFMISLPQISTANPLDSWHWRNPLPQGNLFSITYGNGLFLAVDSYGTILTPSQFDPR